MITAAQRRLVEEQRLGFIATVNADGSPNVSPKATFRVLDEKTLAFAEIRSPNTVENIGRDMRVEVSFVDPFARKGARFRGVAHMVERGEPEFDRLYPGWQQIWGDDLGAIINRFVLITVESVKPLTSPAYDLGADEAALRREWLQKHTDIQRKHIDG